MTNMENCAMSANCTTNIPRNEKSSISDMVLMMGNAMKFFEQDNMTLEEALDIADPGIVKMPSLDRNVDMFKDIKARTLVVNFARKKLEEQKKNSEEEENHD